MSEEKRARVQSALSPLLIVSLSVAAVAFVIGERVFREPTPRLVMDGLAVLGVLALGGLAFRAQSVLPGSDRAFGRAYLLSFALLSLGGALYAGHVFIGSQPDGSPVWLLGASAAFGGGLLTALMVELTRPAMRAAAFVDANRVREALLVAAVLTVALAGLGFLNYAAKQREWRQDYSVGGAHRPSDATIHLIRGSETPVEVVLFFEDNAPALNVVRDYFDGLKDAGAQVRLADAALEFKLAEELKVTQNGTVVVRAGERSEKWVLGRKPDAVQRKLGKLDQEIQKRVAKLGGDPTTFYFTAGHGERGRKKGKRGERAGGDNLTKLIEATNAKAKDLGMGQGLGEKVPDDATAVIVFGPTQPFLEAEVRSLVDYIERGGGLLLMLEPGVDVGLAPVLDLLGVEVGGTVLANDREFVRQTDSAGDHVNLFATSFTNHPAVKALYDTRGKAALRFHRAGSVTKREGTSVKVKTLARSRKGTFEDTDGDLLYSVEKDGKRSVKELIAAIELTTNASADGTRALVIGDSDVLSDDLIRDPRDANGALGFLSALWLARDDDQIKTITAPKQDAMTQTAEEASAWFYVSTVGVPLVILAFGVWYPRRRRQRRGDR